MKTLFIALAILIIGCQTKHPVPPPEKPAQSEPLALRVLSFDVITNEVPVYLPDPNTATPLGMGAYSVTLIGWDSSVQSFDLVTSTNFHLGFTKGQTLMTITVRGVKVGSRAATQEDKLNTFRE